MAKRYKSKALAALHENMSDLFRVGAISRDRMCTFDQLCTEPAGDGPAIQASFAVVKDVDGHWRWLLAADGDIIAASRGHYGSRLECLAAIELVRIAAGAKDAA